MEQIMRMNLDRLRMTSNYVINYEEILLLYQYEKKRCKLKNDQIRLNKIEDIFNNFLNELEEIYMKKKKLESKYISYNYFYPN